MTSFHKGCNASSLTLFAALFAAAASAHGGIIVPGTEQAHIDFAADPVFAPVGWVSGWDGSAWRTVGTGTLVKDNKVLLAGHELTTFGYSQYRFSLGPSVLLPNTGRSVASSYSVLGSGGNPFSPDLGTLTLANPITSVTPAKLYMGDDLTVGTRVIFAGYGVLGYYPSGEIPFDGLKRAGENVIDEIGPTSGLGADRLAYDFGPANGTPSLPLEEVLSQLGSGSPLFAYIEDEWQMVGVGVSGVPLRESLAVIPTMQMHFLLTNGIVAVPEPSTILLATVGAGFVALYCRRRKA